MKAGIRKIFTMTMLAAALFITAALFSATEETSAVSAEQTTGITNSVSIAD